MRAMILRQPADAGRTGAGTWLERVDVDEPEAAIGDVVIRVSVCGVCRTDLDLVEGRLPAPAYPVIPGHQAVGTVVAAGAGVSSPVTGDRVGIAWIHSACGTCRWCRSGRENLCPDFQSTGCDVSGGYADLAAVPAAFAHPIPGGLDDAAAAPLLCAGAIGWRALRLAGIEDGEPLGLAGFGASNHLVLQLARTRYPRSPVSVFARDAAEQSFARRLGAAWAGDFAARPPAPLSAIIDTTPAWRPVVAALAALAPGGRLVVNAIRKNPADQDELLKLEYATHLWMEREIRSVANVTRADVREVLAFAVERGIRPTVTELPLEDANAALLALRRGGRVQGATVLRVG